MESVVIGSGQETERLTNSGDRSARLDGGGMESGVQSSRCRTIAMQFVSSSNGVLVCERARVVFLS